MSKRDRTSSSSPQQAPGAPVAPGASTAPAPDALPVALPGAVRSFRLVVLDGPARGVDWKSTSARCSIGSHGANMFTIQDPTVSRFHCEIFVDATGARVRDLESRNGTIVDGVIVVEAYLRMGSLLRLGKTVLRFEFGVGTNQLPLSEETRFGQLVGTSTSMRMAFALLERAAATDETMLLEGETGTGKSVAALSIHRESARKDGPFTAVDCGAIPANLLESELFGHEKGAFTGATERRIGAFEEASEGTLFLDEIGDLPLDLQVKLLRALETHEVRRVGSNGYRKVNVRVIAATNRDLRAEVNAGRFRADLYFRLAVLTIELPSLRRRPEDIPLLVEEILGSLRVPETAKNALRTSDFVVQLQRGAWPGNVRELRNHVARCLVFQTPGPLLSETPGENPLRIDSSVPYADERERIMLAFERAYLESLMCTHAGKVARAAEAAGLDRTYLYRLLRRHGIEP